MSELTLHLRNFILKIIPGISADALKTFEGIWEPVTVKRKTAITVAGQTERNLYFVMEGVQRVYYLDKQDREATLVFTYPYSFAGVLDSFLLQSPSRYNFETLSHSVLLKTGYEKFQTTLGQHPDLQKFVNTTIHYVLSGLLERIVELQSFSSEEKFRQLLKRSPHILKHVPQKYLANYLGIDATNFSKLINSVKL
jgi:CRP-like cAMP-binding protein